MVSQVWPGPILVWIVVAVTCCSSGRAASGSQRSYRTVETSLESFLLEHRAEVRIRLDFTGIGDKTVLRLVIGVGRTAQDLHEIEFDNGGPAARRIAALCPVSSEEMGGIISGIFRAGLLDDAFRWEPQRHDASSQFLLQIDAAGKRAASSITGDGAAALRKVVRMHLLPSNKEALHTLELVGG
jgi:hypothetical protein